MIFAFFLKRQVYKKSYKFQVELKKSNTISQVSKEIGTKYENLQTPSQLIKLFEIQF